MDVFPFGDVFELNPLPLPDGKGAYPLLLPMMPGAGSFPEDEATELALPLLRECIVPGRESNADTDADEDEENGRHFSNWMEMRAYVESSCFLRLPLMILRPLTN